MTHFIVLSFSGITVPPFLFSKLQKGGCLVDYPALSLSCLTSQIFSLASCLALLSFDPNFSLSNLVAYLRKRVCLSLFICLFGICMWLSLYMRTVFTVVISFGFVTYYFHQSSTIISYFIISHAHWGRIQNIKFERHGLPISIRCMIKPFEIGIQYFVLFVLQRENFCLFLFLRYL